MLACGLGWLGDADGVGQADFEGGFDVGFGQVFGNAQNDLRSVRSRDSISGGATKSNTRRCRLVSLPVKLADYAADGQPCGLEVWVVGANKLTLGWLPG